MTWLMMLGCTEFQSLVMSVWPIDYTTPVVEASMVEATVAVSPVLSGFPQITDVAFFADQPDTLLVTQKEGALIWANVKTASSKVIQTFDVRTASEQGLLSVAVHPQFSPPNQSHILQ